jgi:hypothetical protein
MLRPGFDGHVKRRLHGAFDTAEPAGSDNLAQFCLTGLRAERGANLLRQREVGTYTIVEAP